jgi:RNA polymerase sigma factor (sigma-70 family)
MPLTAYAPADLGRLADRELLDIVQNGEAEACQVAFHALYNRYSQPAWNYLRSALRSQEEAEDRFVETWEVVARKVSGLTLTGSFYGWVLGIARNVIRAHLARMRTRHELSLDELIYRPDQSDLVSLLEAMRLPEQTTDDATAAVLKREEADLLTQVVLPRLMDRHPVPCQVIILSFFAWLSDDEIAEELGMNPGAVRTAKSRALRQYLPAILREALAEMGEQTEWFQALL